MREGYNPNREVEMTEFKEDTNTKKELAKHYAEKLKTGEVGAFIKTLLSDPVTRERFLDLHEDKDVFLGDSQDASSPEKVSSVVVTIMRDEGLKEHFLEAVQREMISKSDLLKEKIAEANKSEKNYNLSQQEVEKALVYDEVIVGGEFMPRSTIPEGRLSSPVSRV